MKKQRFVLIALGMLILSSFSAAYYVPAGTEFAGLACAKNRVIAYGWTHPDRTRAELAAILAWKRETKQGGAAGMEWHNARNRNIDCRVIGGPKGQFQCTISALPCELTPKDQGS